MYAIIGLSSQDAKGTGYFLGPLALGGYYVTTGCWYVLIRPEAEPTQCIAPNEMHMGGLPFQYQSHKKETCFNVSVWD